MFLNYYYHHSLSLSSPFVASSLSRDPYYASLLDFIIREMSRRVLARGH